MSSYSVAAAKHATLSSTTVDTVTVTGAHSELEVYNRAASGGADMFVTVDGSIPSASGDDCFIVRAGESLVIRATAGESGSTVKLIGSGNAYSVSVVR